MFSATSDLISTRAYRPGTLSSYELAVEQVIRAMRAQLASPMSLDEMAEIACLSPFHFTRVFRSVTGLPPGEYLAALRLDAAKRLLLTTSLSVTDVCFDLGYASLGAFSTRFKQQVGVSPLALRQLADGLSRVSPQSLLSAHLAMRRPLSVRAGVISGSISAPVGFGGLIFVGLFPKPLPQGQPIACATLTAPGAFHLNGTPDGRAYLLAAALPWSRDGLSYLLPGAALLVGVAERPTTVRNGRAGAAVELALRPQRHADPPMLGVFPPLLAAFASARNGAW